MIAPNSNEISGVFSLLSNRPPYPSAANPHIRWPSFSVGNGRSFWTKYCILCTVCGSAATILAGIFLVVAALFRYYTTSIYYFETVPTYIPAILLSICGVSTIAFSCKRNRNIILLRITACWSLCSAALSSVITITTSLIHMNRLQTLKECVYNKNPPSCTCFSHAFGIGPGAPDTVHYIFENTPDCDVIHGILYSCLRAVFAISVVAVLLSIFLCMLLYQLIGHERKKAYWSRIRRINSDWSADLIACLARPVPRERSSGLPLVMSPSGTMSMGPSSTILPPSGWGPPPPYEEVADDPPELSNRPFLRPLFHPQSSSSSSSTAAPSGIGSRAPHGPTSAFISNNFNHNNTRPPRVLRLVNSQSENSFRSSDGLISPHPFSPTITSIDPVSVFRHHQEISQSYAGRINNSNSSGTIDGGDSSSGQFGAVMMLSNSSRLADMSSITSLSIPETIRSNTTTEIQPGDSETDLGAEDDLVFNAELGLESSSNVLDHSCSGTNIFDPNSSMTTDPDQDHVDPSSIISISTTTTTNTTNNAINASNNDKEKIKVPKLAASEPKIVNNSTSYYYDAPMTTLMISDKFVSKSSFSRISSLPCSPLLNIKKMRFWPRGGKSVQNLSFSNSNFDYDNFSKSKEGGVLRRRLSRGKPASCLFIQDEDLLNNSKNENNIGSGSGRGGQVDGSEIGSGFNFDTTSKSPVKYITGLKGSSLPASPQKKSFIKDEGRNLTKSKDEIC